MRGYVYHIVLALLLAFLVHSSVREGAAQGRQQTRPNVIFVLIDDMGWKDVGFMGSSYYETPHIDELARQGMVFTAAYSNAPNCAPTRASLMTGQYTPRHGVYTVNSSMRGKARFRKLVPIPNTRTLASSAVTLAEVLGKAGYVSASMGKWHLGDPPNQGPIAQGFDVNVGGYSAGHPNTYFSPYRNPYLEDGPEGEYLTDRLTDEALSFIERNQDQPFFLYLTHYAVHTPLEAPEDVVQEYREKDGSNGQNNPTYAAMVERTDESVGRIMEKLEALNLAGNTIIFFTSDNGGHARATSMEPLRGSKGMLYEGGIRVPLIVRWPGVTETGSTSDTPVISTDFFPTILDMTGAKKPVDHVLDGESFAPLLQAKQTPTERPIFWHFPAYLQAYLPEQGHWRTTPASAVRKGDWKLIEFFEDGRRELYNLAEDIDESNNLAKERPDKLKEMYQVLTQWREEVKAPVPITPNPKYDPLASQ